MIVDLKKRLIERVKNKFVHIKSVGYIYNKL